MADGLKKRWTLPESVITHIFLGETSGNSFGGFHSEVEKSIDNGKMMVDGQPDPEQLRRREAGLTYKLKVKIKLGDSFCHTGGISTFFPNPKFAPSKIWTKANIIRWMEQALTDPSDSVRCSRAAWESDKRKIRGTEIVGQELAKIRVNKVSCHVLYSGGAIASIYPASLDHV